MNVVPLGEMMQVAKFVADVCMYHYRVAKFVINACGAIPVAKLAANSSCTTEINFELF